MVWPSKPQAAGQQVRQGVIERSDLEPLAVFLGRAPRGDVVPACWHWCQLLDPVDPRELDDDGYLIGGVITPEPGMTRMFAGGRVHMKEPLRLGVPTSRSTRVARSTVKNGRHGKLTFVTLESTWSQAGQTLLTDEQDYVFTATRPVRTPEGAPTDPDTSSPVAAPSPAGASGDLAVPGPGRIAVTEPMLVTFSALTANPYRIHWDRAFCARAGHPGLVIHGPLQALWLAEEFTRRGVDAAGRTFCYRLTASATAPAVMSVGEGPDAELAVRRPDGTITATASLS